MALRSVAAELGGVLRLSDRTVQARIGDAREMVEHYPNALDAWEAGLISRGHMNVIVATGRVVPVERRAEFEAEALARSLTDTPNRVRAGLEIYAEQLTARTLTERHEDAARARCVRVYPGQDGMCDLVATVPMVVGDAILDRLTRMGQTVKDARDLRSGSGSLGAGSVADGSSAEENTFGTAERDKDQRGIDQILADVFADLLLAGTPALDPTRHGDREGTLGAIRAQVQVVVPALALVGQGDSPRRPDRPLADRRGHREDAREERALADAHPHRPDHRNRHRRRQLPTCLGAAPAPARSRPALPLPRMPHRR
ncbi:DUF222 domain-containing protein, partial [Schumannella soli]|uniref:DUF222 domain-containing protein n=1 Tax=Schumannella soli TaxID=2590779 RepID=UPI0034E2B6CF